MPLSFVPVSDNTRIFRYINLDALRHLLDGKMRISSAFKYSGSDNDDGRIPLNPDFGGLSLNYAEERKKLEGADENKVAEILKDFAEEKKDSLSAFDSECPLGPEKYRSYAKEIVKSPTDVEKIEKIFREIECILVHSSARSMFISCWSLNQDSNNRESMWNKFAENGVRIETTVEKAKVIFRRNPNICFDTEHPLKVVYLEEEIYRALYRKFETEPPPLLCPGTGLPPVDSPKDFFFIKKSCFSEEEEARFVLTTKNNMSNLKNNHRMRREGYAFFEVSPDDFLGMVLNPSLKGENLERLNALLNLHPEWRGLIRNENNYEN